MPRIPLQIAAGALSAALIVSLPAWAPAQAPLRVVDGDTVAIGPDHFRLANHDAPEVRHPGCLSCRQPRCQREEALGQLAKARLHELTRGHFSIAPTTCANGRDQDDYGRFCAIVYVPFGGASVWPDVGTILIAEGLAVPFVKGRPRHDWCRGGGR